MDPIQNINHRINCRTHTVQVDYASSPRATCGRKKPPQDAREINRRECRQPGWPPPICCCCGEHGCTALNHTLRVAVAPSCPADTQPDQKTGGHVATVLFFSILNHLETHSSSSTEIDPPMLLFLSCSATFANCHNIQSDGVQTNSCAFTGPRPARHRANWWLGECKYRAENIKIPPSHIPLPTGCVCPLRKPNLQRLLEGEGGEGRRREERQHDQTWFKSNADRKCQGCGLGVKRVFCVPIVL
ncbi:hypothetical protein EDD21DRAFT_120800 [Dissophora ornata]|nr:hypothetical protein EDD21DRAFT_120800 [Dissophora ornata]